MLNGKFRWRKSWPIEFGGRFKQYAKIAASGLGLTGGRAPAGPISAQIGIADPCNHECVMCWDHPPKDRQSEATAERFGFYREGVMSLERFKGIVDDLHALGTRRIDMAGRGEPLLNRAVVDMVSYAKERDMLVQLCTNASKLTEVRSKGLVAAGLDRLNISLNAGTPENYPNIHVKDTRDNYLRVKSILRNLADCKTASGCTVPFVILSFFIGTKNYFELKEMVSVVNEVGAQEASFVHTAAHEGTADLSLSREQYKELMESVPSAQAKASELGVQTNLTTFAAIVPSHLKVEFKGPPVVPCYVGWYFSLALANGTVLPCCQCSKPIDRVSEGRSFADIWKSQNYQEFRKAAKALPAPSDQLKGCDCGNCVMRPRNISVHNFLHPWDRIEGGDEDQLFTLADLLRMKKVDRHSKD